MNGKYDNRDLFFSSMKVIKEDMTRNCSRKDPDLILEIMLFVTDILTTGTY